MNCGPGRGKRGGGGNGGEGKTQWGRGREAHSRPPPRTTGSSPKLKPQRARQRPQRHAIHLRRPPRRAEALQARRRGLVDEGRRGVAIYEPSLGHNPRGGHPSGPDHGGRSSPLRGTEKNTAYVMDIEKMTQTNPKSGTVRDILRTTVAPPPWPELDDDADPSPAGGGAGNAPSPAGAPAQTPAAGAASSSHQQQGQPPAAGASATAGQAPPSPVGAAAATPPGRRGRWPQRGTHRARRRRRPPRSRTPPPRRRARRRRLPRRRGIRLGLGHPAPPPWTSVVMACRGHLRPSPS